MKNNTKKSCPLLCKNPKTVCVRGYYKDIRVKVKPGTTEYDRLLKKAGIL